MNSTIQGFDLSQKHVPKSAIVFYGPASSSDQTTYATHHEVRPAKVGFELAPGQSLTTKNIRNLAVQANKGLKQELEIIPENVLVANDAILIWWARAGSRHLTFDVSMHDLPGKCRLQGVSGSVPLPALVFALQRSRAAGGAFVGLSVFALLQDQRPTVDTPLFRAPLFNVDDGGKVCWGDGERPPGKSTKDVPAWEATFFSSVFTHYNGSYPIDCKDPYEFVADLMVQNASKFPSRALKPMKKTLSQVVSALFGGDHG